VKAGSDVRPPPLGHFKPTDLRRYGIWKLRAGVQCGSCRPASVLWCCHQRECVICLHPANNFSLLLRSYRVLDWILNSLLWSPLLCLMHLFSVGNTQDPFDTPLSTFLLSQSSLDLSLFGNSPSEPGCEWRVDERD